MANGALPFPQSGYSVPGFCIYYVSDMINIWATVSSFFHLIWMFLPADILFC